MAVQEFRYGAAVGSHGNIVQYEYVLIHADFDKRIRELLQKTSHRGSLFSRHKRSILPDRFICLVHEFMNRGTVQDWMCQGLLSTVGILSVMQKVAAALAHIHKHKVTHNDIKPANIMLKQLNNAGKVGEVTVKLGDFGLAVSSMHRTADFTQFGLTVHSMITDEKFGARKFCIEEVDGFLAQFTKACARTVCHGRVAEIVSDLPRLLRSVFQESVTMADIRDAPGLQGWSLFDSDDSWNPPSNVQF